MGILLYFSSILLLSSIVEANISIDLTLYSDTKPFVINKDLGKVSVVHEVPNLPRIRSQDSFGTCNGCAASTLVQHKICEHKKIPNCSKVNKNEEVSQLHMISKTTPTESSLKIGEEGSHLSLVLTPSSYAKTLPPSLKIALYALGRNSTDLYSEECLPFDKMVNDHRETTTDQILKQLSEVENEFLGGRFSKTEALGICPACDTINKIFSLNLTSAQVSEFAKKHQDSFESFLYSVVFSSKACKPMTNLPDISIRYFPEAKRSSSRTDAKKFIFDHFSKNNVPLGLSDLCIYKLKDKSKFVKGKNPECWTHEMALTGVRTICNAQGTKCRDEFKVHNCWGQEWQDANNGGWLDADSLLGAVDIDSPEISSAKLTWIK